jgi:hypothetical protein
MAELLGAEAVRELGKVVVVVKVSRSLNCGLLEGCWQAYG